MTSDNIFYVYILFRPWDGSPFYVGKGKGRRWLSHEWPSKVHYNERLKNILIKAKRLNVEIPKVKVCSCLSEQKAFETEKAFIAAIGREETGGPLVNLTDGGEGVLNPSKVSRDKLSLARKARIISPETRAKLSAAGKRRKHTAEEKEKIGAASRGKPRSAEVKEKIRQSLLGRKAKPLSAESRAKLSASLKGHPVSDETKKKIGLANTGRIPDHQVRLKISQSTKLGLSDPEVRKRMSNAAKCHWQNPDFKEKMMLARVKKPMNQGTSISSIATESE